MPGGKGLAFFDTGTGRLFSVSAFDEWVFVHPLREIWVDSWGYVCIWGPPLDRATAPDQVLSRTHLDQFQSTEELLAWLKAVGRTI